MHGRGNEEVTPGRRLRVLTLVDGIGLAGGGERIAREIVIRLDRERFDATLCVSRWSDQLESQPGAPDALEQLDASGVAFVGLRRRSSMDLLAWRDAVKLLRGGGIDILHAHKFGSNAWAAVLGSLARTPVVIAHEHTWSFQGRPWRKAIDRRLIAPRVDAFLTVSREDRRRMIELERIDPDKLIFVPNGIPTPGERGGRDVRAELGIPPEAPVLGVVGALRPQKAHDVLLDAVMMLRGKLTGLTVLIVGDGTERPGLERRIERCGLGGTVRMLGRRTDVADVLHALDVAVSSSDFEGTPLSVLEYMEAGLPIVATQVGGVPDLITHGEHGLLVEPRDAGALAAAVEQLLADPRTAAEMGERARKRRRAEFDVTNTVAAIEHIYSVLASGGRSAELA